MSQTEYTGNFVGSSCKFPDSKCEAYYIAIFAAQISNFLLRSCICLPSPFCVCNNYKSLTLALGKFEIRQGKHCENIFCIFWEF